VGAPKIVITGTGRAGSTLLVQVLDELGLDTGLRDGKLSPYIESTRAGLECRIDDPNAPRVVKSMLDAFRMREILEAGDVEIEHVILPTRRLDIAAASRVRAAEYGRMPFRRGALTGTMRATDQQRVLETMQAEMLRALDDFRVPYTVLDFPRFATDPDYTYDTLAFLLPDSTPEMWRAAIERHVRLEMIHETPLTRDEVRRTRRMTAWMVYVRFPIARVRRRLNPEASKARLRAAVVAEHRRRADDAAAGADSGPDRPASAP
jgi:hypothetical protein